MLMILRVISITLCRRNDGGASAAGFINWNTEESFWLNLMSLPQRLTTVSSTLLKFLILRRSWVRKLDSAAIAMHALLAENKRSGNIYFQVGEGSDSKVASNFATDEDRFEDTCKVEMRGLTTASYR